MSNTASCLIARKGREGLTAPSDCRNTALVHGFHIPVRYSTSLAKMQFFKGIQKPFDQTPSGNESETLPDRGSDKITMGKNSGAVRSAR